VRYLGATKVNVNTVAAVLNNFPGLNHDIRVVASNLDELTFKPEVHA